MEENKILEQLKREALYAQRSFSTEMLYQIYGKALMARQLKVITQPEFMELNHMTVYYMNTDKEYIRHCNENFFNMAAAAEKGEIREHWEGLDK